MENINEILKNPLLLAVSMLFVLREIHSLISAIKSLTEARNASLSLAVQGVFQRLDTLTDVLRSK